MKTDHQKFGLFLDADGVLWPDVGAGGILEGKREAKRRLKHLISTLGHRDQIFIGIVTNQTLAARGEIAYESFRNLVFSLFCNLQRESLIDDFRVCFHHPNAVQLELRKIDCGCRKPMPGMLNDLIDAHNLSPRRSIIIGDRITDVLAGKNANFDGAILLTGSRMFEANVGAKQDEWVPLLPFKIAKDFDDALEILRYWMKHD